MNYKSYTFCLKCKDWDKPMSKHYRYCGKFLTSQKYICRECNSEYQRNKYRNNPGAIKAIIRKSEAKFPEKRRARSSLNEAVRSGRIFKPTSCEMCNESPKRIEGAHIDYSKPLVVRWLCTPCHRAFDRER